MPSSFSLEDLPLGKVFVATRPSVPTDAPFLLRVYAGTREAELARLPWSVAEKQRFLRMQFEAQDHAYREKFPELSRLILLADGRAAGRLYLQEAAGAWRVVDISLLAEWRRRGIGAAVLREVQRQAAAAGAGVTLSVEMQNPARRLYARLGFRETGVSDGVYLAMEWQPGK
ncbi:MAG: GNAT family N-acetyltransferase [Opitutae bacterium]|nr:GNAT family N-acetyltransferase [Opitutae bacterium]